MEEVLGTVLVAVSEMWTVWRGMERAWAVSIVILVWRPLGCYWC